MSSAVKATVSTCFYHLRRIRAVRRALPLEVAKALVNAFVTARLDYGNGLFAGVTHRQLDSLQAVLNGAARVLLGGTRFSRITSQLRDKLHLLKIPQRIAYRLSLLTHKALAGSSPTYIANLITPVADLQQSRRLRSAESRMVTVPRLKTVFGERGFSHAGPTAWNSLSSLARTTVSLASFKSVLKTELFKRSYAWSTDRPNSWHAPFSVICVFLFFMCDFVVTHVQRPWSNLHCIMALYKSAYITLHYTTLPFAKAATLLFIYKVTNYFRNCLRIYFLINNIQLIFR